MPYARVMITAEDGFWLDASVAASTGFATSIIGCGAEAGLEMKTGDTPDGRPGAIILFFARTVDTLKDQLIRRIGQAVLTCPTTAVFNAGDGMTTLDIGARIRYFGDGHEKPATLVGRRGWKIPVTEGEFFIEESFGINDGVAGGSFLIMAKDSASAAGAARRSANAIEPLPGVILPFPGGVCRSASKVGSRYKFLGASTNDKFCPTLRGEVRSVLPEHVGSVMEVLVDGADSPSVIKAMREGITAACGSPGIVAISTANFGGRLGDIKISLHEILGE